MLIEYRATANAAPTASSPARLPKTGSPVLTSSRRCWREPLPLPSSSSSSAAPQFSGVRLVLISSLPFPASRGRCYLGTKARRTSCLDQSTETALIDVAFVGAGTEESPTIATDSLSSRGPRSSDMSVQLAAAASITGSGGAACRTRTSVRMLAARPLSTPSYGTNAPQTCLPSD